MESNSSSKDTSHCDYLWLGSGGRALVLFSSKWGEFGRGRAFLAYKGVYVVTLNRLVLERAGLGYGEQNSVP
jgi:hypothetical protein